MYEEFYNLQKKPFSVKVDESCFFMSRQHADALAAMQYSFMSSAGVTLLTAESGMGKTLIIQRALMAVDDSVIVRSIANTHSDIGSVLPWIMSAFELRSVLDDNVEMFATLNGFLKEQFTQNRRVVLIVEEAQNLSLSALEEIRLVTNLNTSSDFGLQFVLVGKPRLEAMLMQDSMTGLAQRVSLDCRIAPLNFMQTDEYISYRLVQSGGKPELFNYVARACVYYHSRGVPRLINSCCDLALVFGFGESNEVIDFNVIKRVMLSRKASLTYANGVERPRSAIDLHAAILASHGVDIARFSARHAQ